MSQKLTNRQNYDEIDQTTGEMVFNWGRCAKDKLKEEREELKNKVKPIKYLKEFIKDLENPKIKQIFGSDKVFHYRSYIKDKLKEEKEIVKDLEESIEDLEKSIKDIKIL